jgi:hypothetical protein
MFSKLQKLQLARNYINLTSASLCVGPGRRDSYGNRSMITGLLSMAIHTEDLERQALLLLV